MRCPRCNGLLNREGDCLSECDPPTGTTRKPFNPEEGYRQLREMVMHLTAANLPLNSLDYRNFHNRFPDLTKKD